MLNSLNRNKFSYDGFERRRMWRVMEFHLFIKCMLLDCLFVGKRKIATLFTRTVSVYSAEYGTPAVFSHATSWSG